jgi:hypothetical protein
MLISVLPDCISKAQNARMVDPSGGLEDYDWYLGGGGGDEVVTMTTS